MRYIDVFFIHFVFFCFCLCLGFQPFFSIFFSFRFVSISFLLFCFPRFSFTAHTMCVFNPYRFVGNSSPFQLCSIFVTIAHGISCNKIENKIKLKFFFNRLLYRMWHTMCVFKKYFILFYFIHSIH